MKEKILISACLLGDNVKYNGGNNKISHPVLEKLKSEGRLVPICPEMLAGLSVPRPPVEIIGKGGGQAVLNGTARIQNKEGRDVTESFVAGAKKVLDIAQKHGTKTAILKDNSPSCGSTHIYDGTFTGNKITGKGVTAILLENNGVKVFCENDIQKAIEPFVK